MTYCSLTDVKNYLNVTESDDDALIDLLVTAAQKAIDTLCNRTFEASADATRYFDAIEDVEGRWLYLDEDLAQITSVTTDNDGDQDALTLDTHYVTEPRNETPYHALKMLTSSDYDWEYTDDPEMGIEIVGRWAYAVTAPADIKQACIRLSSYYYRQKDAQVFDTTAIPSAGVITVPVGIPADVKLMLQPYVRRLV